MQPIKIEHKLASKLLTKIFKSYVKEQGYSLSNLNNGGFSVINNYGLADLVKHTGNVKGFNTLQYFKELEAQGFVIQNGILYNLTPEGYIKGYKQYHPVKHFLRNHWKVYTGFILTSLIVAVGLMNFLKTS